MRSESNQFHDKCPQCNRTNDNTHFEDPKICDSCVVDKMYEDHMKQQEERKGGSFDVDPKNPPF